MILVKEIRQILLYGNILVEKIIDKWSEYLQAQTENKIVVDIESSFLEKSEFMLLRLPYLAIALHS